MRVSGFTTTRPNMNGTRTYEDFMKFLGAKPARLGIVSRLYEDYTATALTEALMNTVTLEKGKKNSLKGINSFLVEWDLQVNKIERIPMTQLAVGCGDDTNMGKNASEIVFTFAKNYYQKNDIFVVERTRQQFIVVARPQRVSDGCFKVVAKIQDNDYDSVMDQSGNYIGSTTRFVSNVAPELHEEGYVRYQSNVESFRTYIGTVRCDVDMSAQYIPMEDTFIQIGKGTDGDPVYKMDGAEKVCLDSFMEARSNALLWGKTNVDKHGNAKIQDEIGRPLITGDGVIPQIERFATKFVFHRLTTKLFNKALAAMAAKCDKLTGNTFVFMVNTAFWNEAQEVLSSWLKDWKTDGAFVWSKGENGYVKLGATYNAYTFSGNTIIIKPERSLDVEFPYRKYGVMIDLTADSAKGKPALEFYTFKGGDIIHNWINGVGGSTGLASGEVSSPVAGRKIINWGYCAAAVYNPYRSVIMISDEIQNAWL